MCRKRQTVPAALAAAGRVHVPMEGATSGRTKPPDQNTTPPMSIDTHGARESGGARTANSRAANSSGVRKGTVRATRYHGIGSQVRGRKPSRIRRPVSLTDVRQEASRGSRSSTARGRASIGTKPKRPVLRVRRGGRRRRRGGGRTRRRGTCRRGARGRRREGGRTRGTGNRPASAPRSPRSSHAGQGREDVVIRGRGGRIGREKGLSHVEE